jgi:hypothetical protein
MLATTASSEAFQVNVGLITGRLPSAASAGVHESAQQPRMTHRPSASVRALGRRGPLIESYAEYLYRA